jgi:hypothetical protein
MSDNRGAEKGAWLSACEQWIALVVPALAHVALRRQTRGVLVLTVSTKDIADALSARMTNPKMPVTHKGVWLSMEDFLDAFDEEPADFRAALQTMDPLADVAVFVRSSEQADAFTRFLVLPTQQKTVH